MVLILFTTFWFYSDEIDPVRTGTHLFVPHRLELLVSEETIEFQNRVYDGIISEFRVDMGGFGTIIGIYFASARPEIHFRDIVQTDFLSARIRKGKGLERSDILPLGPRETDDDIPFFFLDRGIVDDRNGIRVQKPGNGLRNLRDRESRLPDPFGIDPHVHLFMGGRTGIGDIHELFLGSDTGHDGFESIRKAGEFS